MIYDPMLALSYERLESDDPRWNWDGQRKLDGIRALVYLSPQGNRVLTRVKGKHTGEYGDKTAHIPWIKSIETDKDYVFDGELLWGDNSKEAMKALGSAPDECIRKQGDSDPVIFCAFDILVGWGINYCNRAYFQRHEALLDHGSFLTRGTRHCFQLLDKHNDARYLWREAERLQWEGIMLKEPFGPYECGRRSPNWVKVKRSRRYFAVITGYIPGKEGKTGAMLGKMGSLTLGMWNGKCLVPIGNVGTGFAMDERSPGAWPVQTVIEVESSDITEDGKLWHPRFVRRVPDMEMRDALLEQINEHP